jgi:DNA-3-methyladenine glycosylase II
MEKVMQQAAEHLAANDPVLKPVIERAGFCTLRPHTEYYWELLDGIIGQQLSVQSAAAITARFKALFPDALPTPQQILDIEPEKLRAVGFSGAKVKYVKSLAEHILNGELELDKLNMLSNNEIIAELTAVKGIGEWTAHMFMMFAMGRLDILAVGDLGIKAGIQKLYGFDHLPTPIEVETVAKQNNWAPYQSVACWYVWHAKDNN